MTIAINETSAVPCVNVDDEACAREARYDAPRDAASAAIAVRPSSLAQQFRSSEAARSVEVCRVRRRE